VREMSEQQCWSLDPTGRRCAAPAEPSSLFCAHHRHATTGARIMSVWRAPEAEMPPELVAALRRYAPEVTFPEPATSGDAAPSGRGSGQGRSGDPVSTPGGGGVRGASERTDRTDASSTIPSLVEAGPTPPASPLPGETAGSPQHDWLRAMLREAMEGVMAGDAAPLQKANAVARLAGLYLKACRAKELEQENKALTRRLAAAEAPLAELEMRLTVEPRQEAPVVPQDMGPAEPGGSTGCEERYPSLSQPGKQVITPASNEYSAAPAGGIDRAPLLIGGPNGARDPP